MAKGFRTSITPHCIDECTETLQDVLEEIQRLPRFRDDHVGMYQDDQHGIYLVRDDVLGVFALYLGDLSQ